MKRFYKLVSVEEKDRGFAVLLDGRSVQTAGRKELLVPTSALAYEIMEEWARQGEKIIPDSMPLTQILNTKIDCVSHERHVMSKNILKYLNTDLLCYRAFEPLEIAKAQQEIWDPWLEWFGNLFGERLKTTTGIAALTHPFSIHEKVKKYVDLINDDYFTILQIVTPLSGSLILALAFIENEATACDVFKAARVEEHYKDKLYNAEKYGLDPLQEKKDKAMKSDLRAAARYLELL